MTDQPLLRLNCGCQVTTSHDFLGRTVGTIQSRSGRSSREDHVPGKVVLMPGRENAGSASDVGPRSS